MGTYKVTMNSWGGVKKDLMTGLSYEDAYDFCESNGWQYDTGYIWDLEIELEDNESEDTDDLVTM
jgi:hypothetical protein